MPPMTSQPRRSASRSSVLPSGKLRMPSCGEAISRRSTTSRISSRSSSSARNATRLGSHTSTCERIRPVPWATSQRIAWRARRLTSSWVSEGLRSAHVWMPSISVPDSLWRGSPTVRTASRWTCGSTRGGERRRPSPSRTTSSGPGCNSPSGRIASIRSPPTRRSTGTGRCPPVGWIRTSWTKRPNSHLRDRGSGAQPIGAECAAGDIAASTYNRGSMSSQDAPLRLPHRVTVVGGGFGGLYAARSLGIDPEVRLTLIDRRNFHLFQPLLYQVATGALSPGEIAQPLRSVLRRQRNTTVILGEAIGLDPERREVLLADGGPIAYDTLIVATGAHHSYFDHPDWAALAPGLKTIEDATEIRRRILIAFEAAEREADPERRREWMTFLVVGAGPTGVEFAGALGEIAHD